MYALESRDVTGFYWACTAGPGHHWTFSCAIDVDCVGVHGVYECGEFVMARVGNGHSQVVTMFLQVVEGLSNKEVE